MSLSATVSPIKKQVYMNMNINNNNNGQHHNHPPGVTQHNCSVCSERGFVSKTATPHFPQKAPPPPPPPPTVCHGCVERAAILEEVAGLREMVHTLSAAMMELHERVSVQKQRIVDLESEVLEQKRHNASLATTQAQPQPNIFATATNSTSNNNNNTSTLLGVKSSGTAAAPHSTQISELLEKMLNNNLPAIEARILAQVRKKELEHNAQEFKNIRDEVERKRTEMANQFHSSLSTFTTKASEAHSQLISYTKAEAERLDKAIRELARDGGHNAPPALSRMSLSARSAFGGSVGGDTGTMNNSFTESTRLPSPAANLMNNTRRSDSASTTNQYDNSTL